MTEIIKSGKANMEVDYKSVSYVFKSNTYFE